MIKTNNLTEQLNAIAPACLGNKIMPILSCVKIESVGDDKINIVGSNLEMQIEMLADTEKQDDPVTFCIDADKLIKFSRSNKGQDLEIKKEYNNLIKRKDAGDKVVLKSLSRSVFNTLKSDVFPEMLVNLDGSVEVTLNASDFNHALNQVIYAVNTNDIRTYLQGVNFKIKKSVLTLKASDGHRLAMVYIDLDIDSDIEIECIIPIKTAQAMTKTFTNGDIELIINSSSMCVSDGVVKITGKNIDSKFPDMSRMLDDSRPNHALINTTELCSGIESVMMTTNDLTKGISITFDDDNINIKAENSDGEKSEVDIKCEYFGKKLSLGLNAEYLFQAAKKINGDLSINLSDERTMTLTTDNDNSTHLIMAMNL